MKINVQSSQGTKKRSGLFRGKVVNSEKRHKTEEVLEPELENECMRCAGGADGQEDLRVDAGNSADSVDGSDAPEDAVNSEGAQSKQFSIKAKLLGLNKVHVHGDTALPDADKGECVEAELVEVGSTSTDAGDASLTVSFVLVCLGVVFGFGVLGFALGSHVIALIQNLGVL